MSYSIVVAREARRELERLPKQTARRIADRIDKLAENPRPVGCKKLVGEDDLWRIRIGDCRVVYRIGDAELHIRILRVRHRRDAYE